MNEPYSDEEIRGLFARQRDAGGERATEFYGQLARARTTPPSARWRSRARWPRWAGAGAALAGIVWMAAAVWQPWGRRVPAQTQVSREALIREVDQAETALRSRLAERRSLLAWEAPTDFLLDPSLLKAP